MTTLFFSYSHIDEALRDRLEVHLAGLEREGAISTWHDRRITAGDALGQRIDEHLESADIVLLLVSPDFLASDYCHDVEMQRALARDKEGTARVIPVILRPCDWQHSSFADLLAAPTDGNPITKWANEDEAFLDVVQKIRAALPVNHRPEVRSARCGSDVPATSVVRSGRRSSNLRLRKTFTDADRDRFLDEAFAFMARFFENSLAELGKRNRNIEGRFRQLDGTRFTAVIYESGSTRAQCTISLGGHFGRGISYSDTVGGSGNSFNEMVSIEHDEQHLYLKPMGMGMWLTGGERHAQLSAEGAAEYFWSMLIEPLQQ